MCCRGTALWMGREVSRGFTFHQVNAMIHVNACEDLWPVWMEERCGSSSPRSMASSGHHQHRPSNDIQWSHELSKVDNLTTYTKVLWTIYNKYGTFIHKNHIWPRNLTKYDVIGQRLLFHIYTAKSPSAKLTLRVWII